MNNGINNGNNFDDGATRDLNKILNNVMGTNNDNNSVGQSGFNGDFGMQYQGPRAPQEPVVPENPMNNSMPQSVQNQPDETVAQNPTMQTMDNQPNIGGAVSQEPIPQPTIEPQPAAQNTFGGQEPVQAPNQPTSDINQASGVVNPFLSKMDNENQAPVTDVPDTNNNSFENNMNAVDNNQTPNQIQADPFGGLDNQSVNQTPNQTLFGGNQSEPVSDSFGEINTNNNDQFNSQPFNNNSSQMNQSFQTDMTNNIGMQNNFNNQSVPGDMFESQSVNNLNSFNTPDNQTLNSSSINNNFNNMNQNYQQDTIGINQTMNQNDQAAMPKKKFPLSLREVILVAIAIAGVITVIVMYMN